MTRPDLQQGVGLPEVMLALALIIFTALAVGSMQTSSIVSARSSSIHFSIDFLSSEMLEMVRAQPADAQSGLFDFDGETDTGEMVLPELSSWNGRIVDALPTGNGRVDCDTEFCEVSISWLERVDGNLHEKVYRTRTPF